MTKILNTNIGAVELHATSDLLLAQFTQKHVHAEVGRIHPAHEVPFFLSEIIHRGLASLEAMLIGGIGRYDSKQIFSDASQAMYTLRNNFH